ncbi:MAG TPA: hypothetical protein VN922_24595 [Bacteroidia bacterium]|nr:hypothetical protein [Bacteroidia bacterium]
MTTPQIISTALTAIRNDVINSLQANGRNATGETIAALEIALTESGGQLLAPWWIDALEVGRKPTSQGAVQGNPPMIERIKEWCAAKGIDSAAAWAIKKSIDKYGYPGKPGVLTQPLELADAHINNALEEIAENLQQQIAELFNIFD